MNLNDEEVYNIDFSKIEIEDKWILTRLNRTIEELAENLSKFEFGLASAKIYDFIWNEFCDWYIEFSKTRLYGDNLDKKIVAKSVLVYVLNNILKLLHPFMPFITEEIYSFMPNVNEKLINASFPIYDENSMFIEEERQVENLIETITAIRNKRSEKNIPPSKKSDLYFVPSSELTKKYTSTLEHLYRFLACCSRVIVMDRDEEIANSMVVICNNQKIYCEFKAIIEQQIESLTDRGNIEKKFWKEEENRIRNLTYEKAIEELIITKKLNNKIKQIEKYIGDLKKYV